MIMSKFKTWNPETTQSFTKGKKNPIIFNILIIFSNIFSDSKGGIQDGDDETIDVLFSKMDESVVSLWVFISIYTENKTFDQVKGAYVRLTIANQEFCRFKLTSANDGES